MDDAEIHRQFQPFANKDVQVGPLPDWTHFRRECESYLYHGPYSGLGDGWQTFMKKVHAKKLQGAGPPGDLYICDPQDRQADGGGRLMTLMWVSLRAEAPRHS